MPPLSPADWVSLSLWEHSPPWAEPCSLYLQQDFSGVCDSLEGHEDGELITHHKAQFQDNGYVLASV